MSREKFEKMLAPLLRERFLTRMPSRGRIVRPGAHDRFQRPIRQFGVRGSAKRNFVSFLRGKHPRRFCRFVRFRVNRFHGIPKLQQIPSRDLP